MTLPVDVAAAVRMTRHVFVGVVTAHSCLPSESPRTSHQSRGGGGIQLLHRPTGADQGRPFLILLQGGGGGYRHRRPRQRRKGIEVAHGVAAAG